MLDSIGKYLSTFWAGYVDLFKDMPVITFLISILSVLVFFTLIRYVIIFLPIILLLVGIYFIFKAVMDYFIN